MTKTYMVKSSTVTSPKITPEITQTLFLATKTDF